MKMKSINAAAAHQEFFQDVLALLKKHAGHLSDEEMLAVTSRMVGQMIALQDQRKLTPDQALAIVIANIEAGNREVIASMAEPAGNA